jgi:hypothetical protein
MGKKTKKLEKENAAMKARHDALNVTALKMAEEVGCLCNYATLSHTYVSAPSI